jgi:ABC-2 type transport system permease protein
MEDWIDSSVQTDFDDYIRANLLPDGPTNIQRRLIEGPELTIRSADGKREFGGEAGFIAILFPWLVAMFFFFSIMGASGYFLQAVTDEKENRTMEIMVTSISPEQLVGGKAIGLLGVGLTQIGVWLITIVIGWFVAQYFIEEIQGITMPWDVLLVFLAYFLPSYALVAGMMLGIGGLVTEFQEGQQISGILNLFFTFPLFMSVLIFANPNNPILIFLSFFPTTSFITITMRWGFTVIPFWQLLISWLILVASAVFLVWIAARIFRLGMLRYGQRLKLKTALASIRSELSN